LQYFRKKTVIFLSVMKFRCFTQSDIEPLARIANDLSIWENVRDGFPHPYTIADATAWVNSCTTSEPTTNFAIEYEGQLAGAIGVSLRNPNERFTGEIGYWLGKDFRNKGIMPQVIPDFCRYCFKTFGLLRIEAIVFAHNEASAKVLEKSGFRLEAIHKDAYYKCGKVIDGRRYVIFAADL
jgi:RimJ/RimL family protein N-acetyltransferase